MADDPKKPTSAEDVEDVANDEADKTPQGGKPTYNDDGKDVSNQGEDNTEDDK